MVIIVGIIRIIRVILLFAFKVNYTRKNLLAHQLLETLWTLAPAVVLVCLAIPSLGILFLIEDSARCLFSVKVIGNQWFWEYENNELRNQRNQRFRSYMLNIEDNFEKKNIFRLLDCSSSLYLPVNTPVRVLVTSADVLHSWTVPSLGVKVDACPGRLNELLLLSKRRGLFFGQCSEICGTNHRFMPIRLKVVDSSFWVA